MDGRVADHGVKRSILKRREFYLTANPFEVYTIPKIKFGAQQACRGGANGVYRIRVVAATGKLGRQPTDPTSEVEYTFGRS